MQLSEFKNLVGVTGDVAKNVNEVDELKALTREEIELVNGGFFAQIVWTSSF